MRGRVPRRRRTPRGFTLVELVVVLAVLGVLAQVVAVAARRVGASRATTARADAWTVAVADARHRALTTGRRVSVWVAPVPADSGGTPAPANVLALPDGSVLVDGAPAAGPVDRLTGRSSAPSAPPTGATGRAVPEAAR